MATKHPPLFFHGIDVTNYTRKEFTDPALATRILTPTQLQTYHELPVTDQPRFLAKHWAIREALFKACHYTCAMNTIEIASDQYHHLTCHIDEMTFIISVSYCDTLVFASAWGYQVTDECPTKGKK